MSKEKIENIITEFEQISGTRVLKYADFTEEYDIQDSSKKVLKSDKITETLRLKYRKEPREETVIKMLQTNTCDVQKDILRDFHKVLEMDHPNILTYIDIYYWAESYEQMSTFTIIMKMEAIEDNIDTEITRRKKERNQFTDIELLMRIRQCVDALVYLYNRNLYHMNIKPTNILVDSEGYVKMSDFGFTKERTKKAGSVTHVSVEGTNDYSSPECKQAFNKKDVEAINVIIQMKPEKADVYSLGISLIRCCQLMDETQIRGLNDLNRETALENTNKLIRRLPSRYMQGVFNVMLKHDVENRVNIAGLNEAMKIGRIEILMDTKSITKKIEKKSVDNNN